MEEVKLFVLNSLNSIIGFLDLISYIKKAIIDTAEVIIKVIIFELPQP
jgi:hypothetical protein